MKVNLISSSQNIYEPTFMNVLIAYQNHVLRRPRSEENFQQAVLDFVQRVSKTKKPSAAHQVFKKEFARFERITDAEDPVSHDFVDDCYNREVRGASVRKMIDAAVEHLKSHDTLRQDALDDAGTAAYQSIQNSKYIKSLPSNKRVKAFNKLTQDLGRFFLEKHK